MKSEESNSIRWYAVCAERCLHGVMWGKTRRSRQRVTYHYHGFVENLESSGLAESTVRGVYRLLSSAMRYALEEGVIRKNPCRKIRIQHREHGDQRVLSRLEQEKLRQSADSDRDLPALLSLYTGMRLGEICALKWADIDWEQGTITVRRTVQRIARARAEGNKDKTLLMVGTPI